MLIGHKECILKMRLKRGSGKGATERGFRPGQAEKQAQMRRRACEQAKSEFTINRLNYGWNRPFCKGRHTNVEMQGHCLS